MPFLSLLILAATIVAVVDIVVRDESQIKHLPKLFWILLVVIAPVIGVIVWFAVGREYPERVPRAPRAPGARMPSARMPQAPASAPAPLSTEAQLAALEREIEEDRLRAEIAKRRAANEQRDAGAAAQDAADSEG